MSGDVDIYFVLLGLAEGPRPPNHYQLLGLPTTESNAARIASAADAQIARITPFVVGAHAAAAQRLLAEVATAKAILTTPLAKAAYDAELGLNDPAAEAPRPAPPPAPARRSQIPPPPPGPPEPNDDLLPPVAVPRWAAEPSPVEPAFQLAPPVAGRAKLVAPPGTLPAAVAPDIAAAPDSSPDSLVSGAAWSPSNAAVRSAKGAVARRTSPRGRAKEKQASALLAIVGLAALALAAAVGGFVVLRERESPISQAPPAPGAVANSPGNRPDDSGAASPSSSSVPPTRPAASDNGTKPPSTGAMPSVDADRPAPKPDSPPVRSEPKDEAPADPARAAAVRAALAAARQALAERDLEAADQQIDLAMVDATDRALRDEVERLGALRHYVRGFWNAVRESQGKLKGSEEILIAGEPVIVVEASPDKLVVRRQGENRRYTREQLPLDLAIAVADRWLADDDANSQVFIGAIQAVDPRGDPALARQLWEQAAAAGVDAARRLLEQLPDGP